MGFLVNMKVAACVVVLVAYLQVGAAQDKIKCYQCTDTTAKQDEGEWCFDDIKNLKDCTDTATKSCSKTFMPDKKMGSFEVVRNCSPKQAAKECSKAEELCYCEKDGCNSGRTITLSSTLALTLVLAATGLGLLM
ncbi:hypothetical protein Pcinc_019818 [Petrolisthes cinctipes]|uniref:Protein quiver n=1 Tax=Petrolisthes cinctipes TaxID=88211 RepID=A0AAE1KH88_PETCI|nr:hypothetical protein Pcinc_019818 [Petrolisthes cinctipes]